MLYSQLLYKSTEPVCGQEGFSDIEPFHKKGFKC